MTNDERDRAIADLAQAVQALLVMASRSSGVPTNYWTLLGQLSKKMKALRASGDELDQAHAQIPPPKRWWHW